MPSSGARDIHDFYFREAKRLGFVARSAFKLQEILQKRPGLIRKGDCVLDLGCAPGAWLQVACQAVGPAKAGGLVVGVDLSPVREGLRYCGDNVVTFQGDVFQLSAREIVERIARSAEPDSASPVRRSRLDAENAGGAGLRADASKVAAGLAESGSVGEGSRHAVSPVVTPQSPSSFAIPAVRAMVEKGRKFDVVLSDMMAPTTGHHHSDHYQSIHLARRAHELARQLLAPGGHFVVKVFEGTEYPEFLRECKATFEKVKGFKPKASRNESTEMYVIAEGLIAGGPRQSIG